MPDELWTEVHDIVQETGLKTIPMEKKCKKKEAGGGPICHGIERRGQVQVGSVMEVRNAGGGACLLLQRGWERVLGWGACLWLWGNRGILLGWEYAYRSQQGPRMSSEQHS